jgi:curli production assembly/transport component CsgG
LIIEGIKDELWSTKEGEEKNKEIVDQYLLEQELEQSTGLYERKFLKHDFRHVANVNMGLALVDGDFTTGLLDFKAGLGYKYRFIPELSLGIDAQIMKLNSNTETIDWWITENFLVEYNVLPHDRLSPYFYAGPGVAMFADASPGELLDRWDAFTTFKMGAGVEYAVSDRISFTLSADWTTPFTDRLDDVLNGRRDDYFYNFGVGLNYHFGSKKEKLKINQ